MRHRFHHIRPGDEHVGCIAHHENEIGHRGRIHIAARARPHDDGNLRDHARCQHIAFEHFAVTGQRSHAFLNARATRIEQTDDGRGILHRHVLHLADFLGVRFRQRAAKHGEIFGKDIDHAAIDRAPASDDAIAGNAVFVCAEIGVAVFDEHVEFFERAGIEQQLDTFTRCQLALGVLRLDARFAPAQTGRGAAFFQLGKLVRHVRNLSL